MGDVSVPVLRAEKQLHEELVNKVSGKPNSDMQSKSDTFVQTMRDKKYQESTNNNNVRLEAQYAPEIQLKYKDSNTQTSQVANTSNRKVSHEVQTPFVPGFQTMGRNYNMPDYLIKWQSDQFERSEQRRIRELAEQGLLDEGANNVPVYLSKEPGKVPIPVVKAKSTQYKPSDVGHPEGLAVQKEKSSEKVSRNKVKTAKTEKVTFRDISLDSLAGLAHISSLCLVSMLASYSCIFYLACPIYLLYFCGH